MTTHTVDRRVLIDWFVRELSKVQQERSAREGITDFGEPEWALFEREKLLELVNAERARRGFPPTSAEAIIRVETSASGHYDYTRTLALGAANLAMQR